jgi:vacuolar-type H+-ATPase subunit H
MAPTKKASTKKTRPASSPVHRARKRIEENDRVIRRITDSLDVALKDLPKVGGNVGAGVGELRKDLSKLLRDARSHATKMSKATRKDLEKLQKDMMAAAKSKPSKPSRRAARKPAARKSRATGTAAKSRSTGTAAKSRAKSTARKASSTGTARASRAAAGKASRTTARKRSSSAAR